MQLLHLDTVSGCACCLLVLPTSSLAQEKKKIAIAVTAMTLFSVKESASDRSYYALVGGANGCAAVCCLQVRMPSPDP